MPNPPKILSICIQTYNRANLVRNLLLSLPENDSIEYILVDDGSDEEQRLDLKNYLSLRPGLARLYSKTNEGKVSAFLYGIERASGEFVMPMDDDDSLDSDQLKQLLADLQYVKQHPDFESAGICGLCVDENGKLIGSKLPIFDLPKPIPVLYADYKVRGDKKVVLRRQHFSGFELPVYTGEKRMPTSALWNTITFNHPVLCFNHIYGTKRYLADGISMNMLGHRVKSPNSSRVPYKHILVQHRREIKNKFYLMKCLVNYCRFGFHGASPFLEKEVKKNWKSALILALPVSWIIYILDLIKSK